MIITSSQRVFPFHKESRVFLDSKRILNPNEPPKKWEVSPRVSKTATSAPQIFLYPKTVEQAIYSMQHEIHACGIIFDDEPIVPLFPFGPVWINTNDGIYSWGVGGAKEMFKGQPFQGAFGHLCQDGCKFHSGASSNRPPSLEGIIIKRAWIPHLTQSLQAFVQKNEPWHNGTGVYT